MTDKSWKLLTKLIDACGYDITQIEDEFDFDELCENIKNRLAFVNNYSYDYECQQKADCYFKQLQRKIKECEELENKMAAVIYAATGGRLSYSNYTLNAIEQAFNDQLEILSDRKVEEETTEIKTKYQKYEEALNEIDKEIHSFGSLITIQNIITKAKGEENE